jgi:hypothetical protein
MKKFTAWLKTRQAKFALYTFIYTLVVFAAVGVVNYLAKRYNKSYDATSTKKFSLSDQTVKIAKNLNKKATISYWAQPSKFTAARDLLDRLRGAGPGEVVDEDGVLVIPAGNGEKCPVGTERAGTAGKWAGRRVALGGGGGVDDHDGAVVVHGGGQ